METRRRRSGRPRLAAAAVAVAVGALLPLYGDPRPSPVTHPEWARMVLRALDLVDSVPLPEASKVFATLSWKSSLSYPAERYLKGSGVEVEGALEARLVRASAVVGQVAYPLAVARGGDYRLRLLVSADGQRSPETEITHAGDKKPLKVFSVAAPLTPGWVDAGSVHLDPGGYTASVLLPRGGTLEYLEVAPPCLNPIEPLGGWKPTALATSGDVAVTTLKAVDMEHELPPSDVPLEIEASAIKPEGALVTEASYGAVPGLTGLWLKAGETGLDASVFVDLPEAGLYSLSVFGLTGGGMRFVADGCKKSVLCAETSAKPNPEWHHVLSGEFSEGRHFFSVTLGRNAAIQRLKLERKKDSVADYLGTLRRLGLDLEPEGPVTRGKAVEAMRFIRAKKALEALTACQDVIDRDSLIAGGPGVAQPTTPGGFPGPPGGPTGQPPDPLGPPLLPPQDVASPIVPSP